MVNREQLMPRIAALVMAAAIAATLAACVPAPPEKVVATFEVAGVETYKIELVSPELIDHAQKLLDGENVAAIPLGRVVRGESGVNEPWSWHIDPETLEFAQVTIEVCDGLPSYVEDETVTSADFCPWSAQVVAIDGLPD